MEECQAVAQCLPAVAMASLPSASLPLTHLRRSGEKQFQKFSLMPKPRLGGWHRRTPAQARSTQSWQDDTSQSGKELGRSSPPRSGGAPPMRASQATRRPMSGRRSQQKNRKHEGWSGYREVCAQCHSPWSHAHIKCEISTKEWDKACQWAGK